MAVREEFPPTARSVGVAGRVAIGPVDLVPRDRIREVRCRQSTRDRGRRRGRRRLQQRNSLLELGEPRLEVGFPRHELLHLRRLDANLRLEFLDVRTRVVAGFGKRLRELVEVRFESRIHGCEKLDASARLLARLQRDGGVVCGL